MSLEIRQADFDQRSDAEGIVDVLDSYSRDVRGDGRPLSQDVRRRLVPALQEHPTSLALLAWEDASPIGLAICFRGLSTFRARPLLNIHDLAVIPSHRGKGVGRALLRAAEEYAAGIGCCKMTLEVQSDNHPAIGLYQSFGFGDFEIAGSQRKTVFLQKQIMQ